MEPQAPELIDWGGFEVGGVETTPWDVTLTQTTKSNIEDELTIALGIEAKLNNLNLNGSLQMDGDGKFSGSGSATWSSDDGKQEGTLKVNPDGSWEVKYKIRL